MLRVLVKSKTRILRLRDRLYTDTALAPSSAQVWIALSAALICGVFIVSVALRMVGPTVHPDEWGSLINGQVLIGHNEAPIPTGSFYPAGYGIVTGLGALITGSMAGSYRFSLFSNIVFALLTALSAGVLARKYLGASATTSRLVAALVFVMPGTLVSAMFSWPEIAIRLAFLGLVLSVFAVAHRATSARVSLLALYVGLLPGLHGRFTLVAPFVLLLIMWWCIAAIITKIDAVKALVALTVGYLLARSLNRFVKSTVYLESYNQENRLIGRLFRPEVWPALLRTMVGQSWYLVASSFGLVAVGVVYAYLKVRRSGNARLIIHDPHMTGLTFILVSTLGVIFTGGLQLLYGNRGDHLIYGRYVEMLAPVLLALACVGLEKMYREAQFTWFISAIGIFVFALVYIMVDGGDGIKGSAARKSIVYPNIVGLDFVRYFLNPTFISLGLAFSFLGLSFWCISRKSSTWAILSVVIFLAVGVIYSGQRTMLNRTDKLEATTQSIPYVVKSDPSVIGYDGGIRNDMAYYYFRYRIHPIPLVREFFSEPDAVISSKYQCIYGFGNKAPSQGNWAIVAEEPVLQRVLWKRVEAAQC